MKRRLVALWELLRADQYLVLTRRNNMNYYRGKFNKNESLFRQIYDLIMRAAEDSLK